MKKVDYWVSEDLLNPFEHKQIREIKDITDDHIDAVIKELAENDYIITGDEHQKSYIPVIKGEGYFMVSMRKWGEIMAEAYALAHPDYKPCYRDFYLYEFCPFTQRVERYGRCIKISLQDNRNKPKTKTRGELYG